MEREGCCLPNSGMSEFNPEPSYSRPAMTCKMTYEACGVTRREPAQGGWRGPALLKVRELFRLLERKFWLLGGRDLSLHTDTQNTHTHTHSAVAVLGERKESPSTPQSLCRMETEAHRESPCPLQFLHIQQGWHTQTSPL